LGNFLVSFYSEYAGDVERWEIMHGQGIGKGRSERVTRVTLCS
jgi:hypothetical protein